MTDCFALLGEPRRPWLDPGSLKEKFHKLSGTHHPDVAKGNDVDFIAINAAYNTLLDSKTRIRHLLELENPASLSRNLPVPQSFISLFEIIAREHHRVTAFLEKRASLGSPLEIALLAPKKLELIHALEDLQNILAKNLDEILARLKSLDATWGENKAGSLDALLEIHQGLSYVGKWLGQVQEDLVRLKE